MWMGMEGGGSVNSTGYLGCNLMDDWEPARQANLCWVLYECGFCGNRLSICQLDEGAHRNKAVADGHNMGVGFGDKIWRNAETGWQR